MCKITDSARAYSPHAIGVECDHIHIHPAIYGLEATIGMHGNVRAPMVRLESKLAALNAERYEILQNGIMHMYKLVYFFHEMKHYERYLCRDQ